MTRIEVVIELLQGVRGADEASGMGTSVIEAWIDVAALRRSERQARVARALSGTQRAAEAGAHDLTDVEWAIVAPPISTIGLCDYSALLVLNKFFCN